MLSRCPRYCSKYRSITRSDLERLRARLEKLRVSRCAVALTVAAVIPYAVASLVFESFNWQSLAILAILAADAPRSGT